MYVQSMLRWHPAKIGCDGQQDTDVQGAVMVVQRVEMQNFRGVGGYLQLDLSNGDNLAPILLFGDNGSGKSSLVDALEFGLRGRLSRRGVGGLKQRREVRNLSVPGIPGVLLALSDGTHVRRGGGIKDTEEPDRLAQIVDGFEYCPVVIRRHDVESFWTIPSRQRQQFFFDYLREPGGGNLATLEAEQQQKLWRAQEKLQNAKRRLQRAIGAHESLPMTYNETLAFFHNTLLPRYGQGQRRKRRLPKRTYNAFLEFQGALQKTESIAAQAGEDAAAILPEQQLRQVLATVSGRVSDDFSQVARKDWINEVVLQLDEQDGLDIWVALSSGRRVEPTQVLNEAALDVLALLILVEVHHQCSELGQRKLIVLDDVFQSVDSIHRVRCLEHVIERLRGWQVIMTLHDRLWLELARSAIQRKAHGPARIIEVRDWRHGHPPVLRVAGNGPASQLEQMLSEAVEPSALVGVSGRTLEQLCDRLSITLGTSVTRRREDKYTLGDLWPGVLKTLRKANLEDLTRAAETVDMYLALRNIAGAHYNTLGY